MIFKIKIIVILVSNVFKKVMINLKSNIYIYYTNLTPPPPLQIRGRLAGGPVVRKVGEGVSLGDWFLLYHLGSCMHAIDFAAFLREYARELNGGVMPGSAVPPPPHPTAPPPSSIDVKPMLSG